jgi:hypothetical protein
MTLPTSAQSVTETPFAKALYAPDPGTPMAELVLAQAAPAAVDGSATSADSAVAPKMARPSRANYGEYSREELERKRNRFESMQKTGFGLTMGGIAAGAGGLILMINGLANLETHRDSYGDTVTEEPGAGFWIGYISLVGAFPPLLTTGIILNRIGAHKRQTYERLLETASHMRMDVGPDSFRLSFSF